MHRPEDSDPGHPTSTRGDRMRGFLEHLTGPSRGTSLWLSGAEMHLALSPDRLLRVTDASDPEVMARLLWTDEGCEITALGGQDIWVNGRNVSEAQLLHGDMIEFGEHGPMSRFRLCDGDFPVRWPVDEIVSDAVAYARSSRRPLGARLSGAVAQGGRRLVVQSTVFFRITVTLALLLLAGIAYFLYANDQRVEETIRQEARRIEAVAAALAQTRDNALTPAELAALRDELEARVATNAERLEQLEQRSSATARVIGQSAQSVAFLQGAFGLRHIESGQLMRHMVDAEGTPLKTPFGQPWIDPNGTGAPAEFQFTGTGFLLQGGARMVTNRHVALPWTTGDRATAYAQSGLEPEMLRLIAYLPGQTDAFAVTLARVSEVADLAILRLEEEVGAAAGLDLSALSPQAGDEVVLMGYPTGLRALLAQAGPEFLTMLQETGSTDFWVAAERLASAGLIRPLASRGIIAQVNAQTIVYDAETTVGGSGGPALDLAGRVVAVNAAILPEFGGSNIGVPVAALEEFLREDE